MSSGRSLMKTLEEVPPTPRTMSTAWMPTSCSAMYGMVARMPVTGDGERQAPGAVPAADEVGRR